MGNCFRIVLIETKPETENYPFGCVQDDLEGIFRNFYRSVTIAQENPGRNLNRDFVFVYYLKIKVYRLLLSL